MDVNEVFVLIKYIINKNQNGLFDRSDFFAVINQAQRQYQSWLLGSFQTYTPGRPIAKVELGQNSVVRQRLSPVIYRATLTIDGSGNATYPANYIQTDSMYMVTGNKRIRNVQQNALDSNINSVIDPVATNPIYLIEDTRFQFYPVTLVNSKLTYVGDAPDIVWGFTLDGNGREIYDAGTSVQPVWDDIAILDIIDRALKMPAINLQNVSAMQYASELKSLGQ